MSLKRVVLGFTASVLLVLLVVFLQDRLGSFNSHSVGVSITAEENSRGLEFPAVTACFSHFDFQAIKDDVGAFQNPFAPKQLSWRSEPTLVYGYIERELLSFDDFLYKYYLRADQLFINSDKYNSVRGCTVGGELCEVRDSTQIRWSNGNTTQEVEVPGGKWVSRVLADSLKGDNMMCHTLIPNVTADFSKKHGNSISFRWGPTVTSKIPWWHLYIHDKHEHVILRTYVMRDMPYVILRHSTYDEVNNHQARVKIVPRLVLKPGTRAHPCVDEPGYSQNLCYLQKSWESRMETIREYYGLRFDCVVPGVVLEEGMPLCTKASGTGLLDFISSYKDKHSGSNATIGYLDLISLDLTEKEANIPPNLISPPIGTELEKLLRCDADDGSLNDHSHGTCPPPCLPRCEKYDHQVTVEAVDGADWNQDVNIYFPSSRLETWKEFEQYTAISLISDVGGLVGLLMGLSLLSMVDLALNGLARMCGRRRRKRKSEKKQNGNMSAPAPRQRMNHLV